MVVSMKIDAGLVKQVKAGFSWTAFFNKQTAHYYLEHGYKPVGEGWDVAGPKWGISFSKSA